MINIDWKPKAWFFINQNTSKKRKKLNIKLQLISKFYIKLIKSIIISKLKTIENNIKFFDLFNF